MAVAEAGLRSLAEGRRVEINLAEQHAALPLSAAFCRSTEGGRSRFLCRR